MKSKLLSGVVLFAVMGVVCGQGVYLYDQQSGTSTSQTDGGAPVNPNYGQSFTPVFSSVGFIQLGIYGGDAGGTLYVRLMANSLSGTILGSTEPIILSSGGGVITFQFSTPISVSPNTTYYFQPVAEIPSNWGWALMSSAYSYSGGTAIIAGVTAPNSDFFFREGITAVPEPSAMWLGLLSGLVLFCTRRKRRLGG